MTGTYTARRIVGRDRTSRSFDVKPDLRWKGVTHQDLVEQFQLATTIRDTLNHVHGRIDALRSAREQVEAAEKRAKDAGVDVSARADSLVQEMTALEKDFIQTRNRSGQDPIRFPPTFDNQVATVYGDAAGPDGKLTDGARQRWTDLLSRWTGLRGRLHQLLDTDVGAFNQLLQQKDVPAVVAPKQGGKEGSGAGEGRSVGEEVSGDGGA